eukprot:3578027-Pyramimonas_sp.AAC.2
MKITEANELECRPVETTPISPVAATRLTLLAAGAPRIEADEHEHYWSGPLHPPVHHPAHQHAPDRGGRGGRGGLYRVEEPPLGDHRALCRPAAIAALLALLIAIQRPHQHGARQDHADA